MKFEIKQHPVTTTAGGAQYSIDSYHYHNNPGGKIFYIQANVHGIEIAGIPVIYELMDFIEKNKIKINIICVPKANPFGMDSQIMGVQTGYNNIHTNTYNCINYNRIGANNSQLFEAQLNNILLGVSGAADVVIDLHSAGFESVEHIYCHEKFIKNAKFFGIDNNIYWNEPGEAFEDICYKRGQESYTLELGASRRVESDRIIYFLEAIKSFLFENESEKNMNSFHIDGLDAKIFASTHGILVWKKEVGDYIQKGQQLGIIYNSEGKHEITSQYEGIFLIKNSIHAPFQNQAIGQILRKK